MGQPTRPKKGKWSCNWALEKSLMNPLGLLPVVIIIALKWLLSACRSPAFEGGIAIGKKKNKELFIFDRDLLCLCRSRWKTFVSLYTSGGHFLHHCIIPMISMLCNFINIYQLINSTYWSRESGALTLHFCIDSQESSLYMADPH